MKNFIKIISLVLTASVILSVSAFGYTENVSEGETRLYSTYGDYMLFQHDEPAVLAGTAPSGSRISCELKNAAGEVLKRAESSADSMNTFSVSFDAPSGGYDKYTIETYKDGLLFSTLHDVVFGELWLAGGQSNMHIFLRFSRTGTEMVNNGQTGSENIRFLNMPLIPGYNADPDAVPVPGDAGTESPCPLLPQKDVAGAHWFKGNSPEIYDITAVGYFFASKLQKDIDMPVGVLCDYLGGSGVYAWLSREAIESDKAVKKDLGNGFIPSKRWDERKDYNNLNTMTVLYNKKTAPLTNFRIAGMIWYQGESDCGREYGVYSRAFSLLQRSLTKDFHYSGKSLPVIFTTFADWSFGGINAMRELGAELGEFAAGDYSSRSVLTISDLPLGYTAATQTCHPYEKKPVGERMATAAEGLVYGKYSYSSSSPVLKSYRIESGSIYLTFEGVCDGLVCKDKAIHGFTVCGKNGVYVPANAEIVSGDTVKVYSDSVKKPVAAMYSQGQITSRSNLFSSIGGTAYLPVCHTITDRKYVDRIWQDCGWTDCDCRKIWHQETLDFADFFDTWNGISADTVITEEAAFSGDAGLRITASPGSFSAAPAASRTDPYSGTTGFFQNWERNLQSFSSVSVMLRNDGREDVTLDGLKLTVSENKVYMPAVNCSKSASCTVPADGKWYRYTFDLENMYKNGTKSPVTYTRKNLRDVTGIAFTFSSGTDAQLSLDDVQFTPYVYPVSHFRLFGMDVLSFFGKLFS